MQIAPRGGAPRAPHPAGRTARTARTAPHRAHRTARTAPHRTARGLGGCRRSGAHRCRRDRFSPGASGHPGSSSSCETGRHFCGCQATTGVREQEFQTQGLVFFEGSLLRGFRLAFAHTAHTAHTAPPCVTSRAAATAGRGGREERSACSLVARRAEQPTSGLRSSRPPRPAVAAARDFGRVGGMGGCGHRTAGQEKVGERAAKNEHWPGLGKAKVAILAQTRYHFLVRLLFAQRHAQCWARSETLGETRRSQEKRRPGRGKKNRSQEKRRPGRGNKKAGQ